MYTLFDEDARRYGSSIGVSWAKDVEKRIVEDVARIIQYYRYGAFHVKSDHLLVRFINAMSVPLTYDVDRYYEVAAARGLYVANSFEFSSAINAGRWFTGVFYHGCDENIFAYLGEDLPRDLEKRWRDLAAVTVLEHPVTNLKYMLPDGRLHNTETGMASIAIDIPALMIQYRAFMKEQEIQSGELGEIRQGAEHFVAKYVLPNMLKRQTDLVLINRLIALYTGQPFGDSRMKHPFHLTDVTGWVTRGLKETLQHIAHGKRDYANVLNQLPRVFEDRPTQMPDIVETRQVWWRLFLTRVKLMQFLYQVVGPEGRGFNQMYQNRLKIDVRRLLSDGMLKTSIPFSIQLDLEAFLNESLGVSLFRENARGLDH